MNQRTEQSCQAQFAALERLRQDATASELKFYRSAEAELKEWYEFERSLPDQPTSDSLGKRYAHLQKYLARLEYELGLPELGEHWHHWAKEEVTKAQQRLSQTRDQLEALGMDSDGDIPPDRSTLESDLKRGALSTRLEELRMLYGLKTAWLERRGATAEAIRNHAELQRLSQEIQEISSQLTGR